MGVAVDEARHDRATVGVNTLVRRGCRRSLTDPGDAAVVYDDRRVGEQTERAVTETGVVRDELADGVDEQRHPVTGGSNGSGMVDAGTTSAGSHNGVIAADSAGPTSMVACRSPCTTVVPSITTCVTSAAVAA